MEGALCSGHLLVTWRLCGHVFTLNPPTSRHGFPLLTRHGLPEMHIQLDSLPRRTLSGGTGAHTCTRQTVHRSGAKCKVGWFWTWRTREETAGHVRREDGLDATGLGGTERTQCDSPTLSLLRTR